MYMYVRDQYRTSCLAAAVRIAHPMARAATTGGRTQELFFFLGDEQDAADDDGDEEEDEEGDNNGDADAAASSRTSRRRRRSRTPPATTVAASPSSSSSATADETRACVTIVGNYVRACGETSASFFRDILPKVLLMGMAGGGGGRRRRGEGSKRIPRRLAALLRSLVASTRQGAHWYIPISAHSSIAFRLMCYFFSRVIFARIFAEGTL